MKRILIVVLIVLSCLPLVSLLHPGLPVTHDGQDHVARIANFYASLSEKNLIPRWASNLNWGFGHPILMFLYPLPSYTASIFHVMGFSLVDSTKVVFALSFILSILFMYLWAKDVWGAAAGVAAGILYGFNPYRFVDLYVRGALGEDVAFVFLPIILWGLFGLSQKRSVSRWGLVLTMGISGLLLSHNAISLMMIPVAMTYAVYLFFYETYQKQTYIYSVAWSVLLGFSLSAFFWMPALLEGKYTLRNIVTSGEAMTRMVPPLWFLYSPWNYGQGEEFTKQIGIVHWISILAGIYFLIKSKSRTVRLFIGGVLVLFLVSLVFMTNVTGVIWSHVMLMQNFQFPWRILTVSVLLSSIVGAVVTAQLPPYWKKMVVWFVVVMSISFTAFMWHPKAYKVYDEPFFTGIYNSTTDTGESSPIWSVRFMEFRPTASMEVATGSASITSTNRSTTVRDYNVIAHTKTRLVENTLYFPGWNVYVDGKDTAIEFQDPEWRGRMTFWVDGGMHSIHIVFTDTKLRQLADGISFISLIIMAGIVVFPSKKPKVKQRSSKKS